MGSGKRGLIRAQLEQEVRHYLTNKALYEDKVKQAKEQARPGNEYPKPPVMPEYLALGLEMQRWGVLLVNGGLLDQPAWTWELVDLALSVYYAVQEENRINMQLLTGQQSHGIQ